MVIPNMTETELLAFYRREGRTPSWYRYPIVAWEIERDADGHQSVTPIATGDLGECWCIAAEEKAYVFMDGTPFNDLDDVVEQASLYFELTRTKAS